MKRKAKRLQEAIHSLQSRLYYFADELEDAGKLEEKQLAMDAGFELDISSAAMKKLNEMLDKPNLTRFKIHLP